MRLYHFLAANWALDDIERKRLKTSQIDDTNDPYEASCISDDILTQAVLDTSARTIFENWGVVCFSSSWDNVLMWSHYADRHKGMCLGLDVDDKMTLPIKYVAKPLLVGAMHIRHNERSDHDKNEAVIRDVLGTKYDGWSYEKEIRVHATRKERDESTGHYFANFTDIGALREIIIGARCQIDARRIEGALQSYADRSAIKIFKARASAISFKIVACKP